MSVRFDTLKEILCGSGGNGGILQDSSYYSGIGTRINDAVTEIAAGIRMPPDSMYPNMVSPPLPDLFDTDTVATSTTYPYKSLPSDYQRNVHMIADDSGYQLFPPKGGDYYSFALFQERLTKKDMSESGSIWIVCVKGTNLYYQGIPTSSEDLTVNFYRAPVDMSADDDTVDGIPDHIAKRVIKHKVAYEVMGEIEDLEVQKPGYLYHQAEFYKAMTELIDYIGIDETPVYYGSQGFVDLGKCD